MSKLKALLKDKKVVTGLIAALILLTGAVIEPQLVEQVVDFITGLGI